MLQEQRARNAGREDGKPVGTGRRQARRWGKGPWSEWGQKGARPGKLRRSPVGETSLFGGENKGEGEMMEEA